MIAACVDRDKHTLDLRRAGPAGHGVRALFLPSRSALGRAEQPAVRHLAHCEFRAGY